MKNRIRKGDTVLVIAGGDKVKKGKIFEILPNSGKIKVEGVNIRTRHVKPRTQGQKGGIIQDEGFIDISNVMPLDKSTKKPVRACKIRREEKE